MMTPSPEDLEPENAPKVPGFTQFEFALTDALIQQLIICLDNMDVATLTAESLAKLPNEQGVYQLYLDGRLQYVGKTDRDAGLRKRLTKHLNKTNARPNLRGGRVTFKAVQVLVFTAVELEAMLIKHYQALDTGDAPMEWQNSGFGSNDPGKRRDETVFEADHFDSLHPIDTSEPTPFDHAAADTVGEFLKRVKAELDYTFRFQAKHKDLNDHVVGVDGKAANVEDAIVLALSRLPAGWQAINLPGYVIMYKNDKSFPSGRVIGNS